MKLSVPVEGLTLLHNSLNNLWIFHTEQVPFVIVMQERLENAKYHPELRVDLCQCRESIQRSSLNSFY